MCPLRHCCQSFFSVGQQKYYQAHINGNVEYSRQRYLNAIECFKELLTIDKEDTSTLAMFYLSYLRLAHLSFECEDFELALQAYELCVPTAKTEKNFMANYGMGLTLYYVSEVLLYKYYILYILYYYYYIILYYTYIHIIIHKSSSFNIEYCS